MVGRRCGELGGRSPMAAARSHLARVPAQQAERLCLPVDHSDHARRDGVAGEAAVGRDERAGVERGAPPEHR